MIFLKHGFIIAYQYKVKQALKVHLSLHTFCLELVLRFCTLNPQCSISFRALPFSDVPKDTICECGGQAVKSQHSALHWRVLG